jgi:dCMP deaminase
MQMLCAYGIKEVYYRDIYPESESPLIAERYGIKLIQMTGYPELTTQGAQIVG